MTQTIVGQFDTASEAQSAVSGLLNGGFERENIDLSTYESDATASADSETNDGGSVSEFLGALFGTNDDDPNRPDAPAGQRNAVVTVYAQSADMAERAADILAACGAVDIEEKTPESSPYTTQDFPGTVPPVTADPAGGVAGYTTATTHKYAETSDRRTDTAA
ncbi:hypothetical protein [Fibrella arboris]|uniref:hypothetical protein n=1 Tax=Fibrella arboris TaxID=3242486 RepID=UPI003521526B